MKRLIVIIGPNAVGKTTTAMCLVEKYSKTAYVDSDWCRVMNPFPFTEITKQTITENMYALLHNYLLCEEVETVVFTYSWHGERKEIYDNIIVRLQKDKIDFEESIIILKCSKEENVCRARKDNRDDERIARGMRNTFYIYDVYPYPCIDTTDLLADEVAEKIVKLIFEKEQ